MSKFLFRLHIFVHVFTLMVNGYGQYYSSLLAEQKTTNYRMSYGNQYRKASRTYHISNYDLGSYFSVPPFYFLDGFEDSFSDDWVDTVEEPEDTVFERLNPDFSCHPGFNTDNTSLVAGQGYLNGVIKDCEESSTRVFDGSYSGCLLAMLYIMNFESHYMEKPQVISRYFRKYKLFTTGSEQVGTSIAEKIFENCNGFAWQLMGLPWDSKSELYECIQKAWSC